MTEREEKLHRTWSELLLERGRQELASIAVESEVEISEGDARPKRGTGDPNR
jgi:hypothetical protein